MFGEHFAHFIVPFFSLFLFSLFRSLFFFLPLIPSTFCNENEPKFHVYAWIAILPLKFMCKSHRVFFYRLCTLSYFLLHFYFFFPFIFVLADFGNALWTRKKHFEIATFKYIAHTHDIIETSETKFSTNFFFFFLFVSFFYWKQFFFHCRLLNNLLYRKTVSFPWFHTYQELGFFFCQHRKEFHCFSLSLSV